MENTMEEKKIETVKAFSSDLLYCMRQNCAPPYWIGNPVFDAETGKLTGLLPRKDGALKLWFKPGIDNAPTIGPFTVGCNIAAGCVGDHSESSVITAMDNRTGEQVLEFKAQGLEPRVFARMAVGLCVWLRNALLGWEDSGVSGGFAKEVVEVLQYSNVFFRDVHRFGSQEKIRRLGWSCRDAAKTDMFQMMSLAIEVGKFVPRSEEMITECGEYELNGAIIVHAPENHMEVTDKSHGERALAAAGCFCVFNTARIDKIPASNKLAWFADKSQVEATASRLIEKDQWQIARRLFETLELMKRIDETIQESFSEVKPDGERDGR